jgi:mono/diheme cytochrome c family protein
MRRALLVIAALLIATAGGVYAWATRHPVIEALAAPPDPRRFDAALVERGETLTALGYCEVCHTRPGGQPFAGGLPLPTPFGTIYSTNITPDPETGIGRWSEEAFRRAMHEGIDRQGRHLYPVFPYDHFTRVTDEDVRAIYAYLMRQRAVRYASPRNELSFPFDQRITLAGWNLLFFKPGRFVPDPSKDEKWNRGAYLAEGLAHCGSCHTPRNALGGLDDTRKFAGGDVEGWHGTALDGSSPAPLPWTAEAMLDYLFDGRHGSHGIAAGPMTPVVNMMENQAEEDVEAIAAYVASFQSGRRANREAVAAAAEERQLTAASVAALQVDASLQPGRDIFVRSCINCHRKGEKAAPLALTSTVNGPDPRNVIQIVLHGIRPPKGARDFSMPASAWMSDQDLVNITRFVRAQFSDKGPWPNLEQAVREVRAAPKH